MLKRSIISIFILAAVMLKPFSAFAASFAEEETFHDSKKTPLHAAEMMTEEENPSEELDLRRLVCAFMSLAAYDDRIGLAARAELKARGWELMEFHKKQKNADTKFYYAKREDENGNPRYLLAVTGTESKKDVNIDLKVGKVYFAGTTKEEFAENAANHNVKSTDPQVHGGFNEYTQAAFFTPAEDGRIVGEFLRDKLKENPEAKLIITGHSLGGAVGVILGARLLAMGVSPEQITVVSFGAPAVGNTAFVKSCADLQLDRVVISGDPVRGILQTLNAGYKQFEQGTNWKRNSNADIFRHSMTVYLDAAIRAYYEKKTSFPPADESDAKVYSVVKIKLNSEIESDRPYMERAVKDFLQSTHPYGVIFASNPEASQREQFYAAKKAGCEYVIVHEFIGNVLRDKRGIYLIELHETVFDEVGNLIGGFAASTSTRHMTPIEGALYDIAYARDERERLTGK